MNTLKKRNKNFVMVLLLLFLFLHLLYSQASAGVMAIDSPNEPLSTDVVVGSNITDLKAYRNPDNTALEVQVTTKDAKKMTTTVTAKNNADSSTVSICPDGFCNRDGNEHLASSAFYCPEDCPLFCGDGSCSASEGETCSNCSQDCGACAASCGDGTCNGAETCATCPQECGSCCGNGTCDNGETYISCPADGCPHCPDGVCEPNLGETRANCSSDCKCGDGVCELAAEGCGKTNYCNADCGACGGSGGCFLAGTLITMADGKTKAIEEIKEGDVVLSFDEATKSFKPDKVNKLLRHIQEGYLIVNGHLKVTPNHVFLADSKAKVSPSLASSNGLQWVRVGSLQMGDRILNENGDLEAIRTIEKINGKIHTYNFEVNPYHTYIAGGYVVHNAKIPSDNGGDDFNP